MASDGRSSRSSSSTASATSLNAGPLVSAATTPLAHKVFTVEEASQRYMPRNESHLSQLSAGSQVGIQHQCIRRLIDFDRHFQGDPFVGILRPDRSTRLVCCSRMALIKLQQQQEEFQMAFPEIRSDFSELLTPFGRRLFMIASIRDFDLLSFWRLYPYNSRPRDMPERLTAVAVFTDSDAVIWSFEGCSQCGSICRFVRKPPCCRRSICQPCWQSYVRSPKSHDALAVQLYGMYCLHCYGCSRLVPYSQAQIATDDDDLNLVRRPDFHQKLTDGINEASREQIIRCPTCLVLPQQLPAETRRQGRFRRGGIPYRCARCRTEFCQACGIAAHPRATCREMLGGSDIAIKLWAKQNNSDVPNIMNAQQCPQCETWVSQSSDCPTRNVECRCGCDFYYCCGRDRGIDLLHYEWRYSRYVPFLSCPKLWNCQKQRLGVHVAILIVLIILSPIIIILSPCIAVFCCLYVKYSNNDE